jgi:hypothetical protein
MAGIVGIEQVQVCVRRGHVEVSGLLQQLLPRALGSQCLLVVACEQFGDQGEQRIESLLPRRRAREANGDEITGNHHVGDVAFDHQPLDPLIIRWIGISTTMPEAGGRPSPEHELDLARMRGSCRDDGPIKSTIEDRGCVVGRSPDPQSIGAVADSMRQLDPGPEIVFPPAGVHVGRDDVAESCGVVAGPGSSREELLQEVLERSQGLERDLHGDVGGEVSRRRRHELASGDGRPGDIEVRRCVVHGHMLADSAM